jgi:hypothetical protein
MFAVNARLGYKTTVKQEVLEYPENAEQIFEAVLGKGYNKGRKHRQKQSPGKLEQKRSKSAPKMEREEPNPAVVSAKQHKGHQRRRDRKSGEKLAATTVTTSANKSSNAAQHKPLAAETKQVWSPVKPAGAMTATTTSKPEQVSVAGNMTPVSVVLKQEANAKLAPLLDFKFDTESIMAAFSSPVLSVH